MRTRFDQFAKQVLAGLLSSAGEVQTERDTSAEPQTVDLWFSPSAAVPRVRRCLGVAGLLAHGQALIEPFHEPPCVSEVLDCVAKQLSMFAEQRRVGAATQAPPALWILSAGVPRKVVSAFELRPLRHVPAGILTAAPGCRLHVVVISSLPRTRATLLLRLLGAGQTFALALQDLKTLPAASRERILATPLLARYRIEVQMQPGKRTKEEEAIMNAQWVYDEMIRTATAQGVAQGVGAVVRVVERRLNRALSEDERLTVRERLSTLGPERLGDVVLDLSAEQLADWLADPDAR